jgi:hypothetical protein
VTLCGPGWMATKPLNRLPSTNTGQIRSAPTGSREDDPKPTNGIAINGPELLPVGIGRQIRVQQPDHAKGYDHLPIAAILPRPWTDISAGEKRYASQRESHYRQRDQRRVREECRKSAPPRAQPSRGTRRRPHRQVSIGLMPSQCFTCQPDEAGQQLGRGHRLTLEFSPVPLLPACCSRSPLL